MARAEQEYSGVEPWHLLSGCEQKPIQHFFLTYHRCLFVWAKEVNVSSKDCLNSQTSLPVGSVAFPSCSASRPRLLPPLLKQCPELEPDSLQASGCRQPALTYPVPWKPSSEWLSDPHGCREEGSQGRPGWQMAQGGMLSSDALYLCCRCHRKLSVTVFSLAVHGLEERAFVVTQECGVFLATRFCFRHVHRALPVIGMEGGGWAKDLRSQQAQLRSS